MQQSIASKPRAQCGVFLTAFISRDKEIRLKLYTRYVRPLLEYGCAVWGPVSSHDINTLEKVQRYFTNKIRGCIFFPYNLRLSILSLNSLQHRRTVSDLAHSLISGHLLFSLTPHICHITPSIYLVDTISKSTRLSLIMHGPNKTFIPGLSPLGITYHIPSSTPPHRLEIFI